MFPNDKSDSINGMYILELAYRLVVAVNISECKLESIAWMESWNSDIVSCVEKWRNHLNVTVNGGNEDFRCFQFSTQIIEGLSRGYSRFISEPSAPSHDFIVYRDLLEQTAIVAVSFQPTLSECFILGRQLAQNDLRAYCASKNKQELRVAFAPAFESFTPLTEDSFPLSLANWPNNQTFNSILNRYVTNRQHLTSPISFSVGALLYLVQSVVCPSGFPSTVWCWEDWEGSKPWHLLLAGSLFPNSMLITVKDQNDKAFVILFEVMDGDKKAGKTIDKCGWMLRKELWPGKNSDTCRHAWEKLTGKTLAALGTFSFDGEKGKNRKTGGYCRLPSVFAESDCQIFIERLK